LERLQQCVPTNTANRLTHTTDAANDRIVANRLTTNMPDLFNDGTGTNITFAANHCTTSTPNGLC